MRRWYLRFVGWWEIIGSVIGTIYLLVECFEVPTLLNVVWFLVALFFAPALGVLFLSVGDTSPKYDQGTRLYLTEDILFQNETIKEGEKGDVIECFRGSHVKIRFDCNKQTVDVSCDKVKRCKD